jgi:hypothetical protein
MTTLRDLRATLEQHAASVDDTERFDRPRAIHERVRVLRRRRNATVAAVAAVAVVVAVASVGLLRPSHQVEPADRLGNVDVPAEVELSERTFVLDEVLPVEPGVETALPESAVIPDMAVSLVGTGLGTGRATLAVGGELAARLAGGLEHSPAIPYSLERTAAVRVDGAPAGAEVGLAVYRATSTTTDDAVFQRLAGVTELAATALSDPGESSTDLTLRAAANQVTLATYCSSDAQDLQVNISIDGGDASGEPCSQALMDHGFSGTMDLGTGDRVRDHTVRVYLTRASDDTEVSVPGVVVGVGAYLPIPGPRPLGVHVARTAEWFGRTWTLEKVVASDHAGAETSTTVATGEGDALLRFVSTGPASATWTGRFDEPTSQQLGGNAEGEYANPLLLPGDTYEVEVTPDPGAEAAILVYRPE